MMRYLLLACFALVAWTHQISAAESWFLAPLKGDIAAQPLEEKAPSTMPSTMPNMIRPVKLQDTVRADARVFREAPPAPLVTTLDAVTAEEAIAATQNSRQQNLGCGAGGGGCGGRGRGLFRRR